MARVGPQLESDGDADAARAHDAEMVARARTGDRRALAEIYRGHRRTIGHHLRMLTGDPSVVDDLVQDTFVTAFGQLDRFTGKSLLATWLHGICINVARNHRAKRRRRQGLLQRVFAPRQTEIDPRTPEADVRQREALARLYAILDELPNEQREAFVLRVIEDIPLKRAAAVLAAPIATVSYRARQAEMRVRTRLTEEGVVS